MMDRRAFITIVSGSIVAAPLAVGAQQAAKIPRVGLLRPGTPPDPYADAFRQGLRDLGYVEQQTVAIEFRWAEGNLARLPLLAAELVDLKVDVIVTQGEAAARAARDVSRTIPIVMARVGDAVEAGLVVSLARPGRVRGSEGEARDGPHCRARDRGSGDGAYPPLVRSRSEPGH